jgi:spore germination protein GerM
VALAVLASGGCARHPLVVESHQITVYYCKNGTEALVPLHYAADPKQSADRLAGFAVNQLLAGPGPLANAVVLFPPGTHATVSVTGETATVNLTGSIASGLHAGATDEVALFKSLTYTVTNLPDIKNVQVLIAGQKVAALPGGHLDLSEPLDRDAFEQ